MVALTSVTIDIAGSRSTIPHNAAASNVRGEEREGHWVHNPWYHPVAYTRETTSPRSEGGGGLGGRGAQANEDSKGDEGGKHLGVALGDDLLYQFKGTSYSQERE
jgi:hypothetical protein